jgi:putative ABC transport system permease protein
MDFSTVCRDAFTALHRNWMRSVLTILGIAIGVASFICVVAIGSAGSAQIEDQLQSLGDNFIWVEAGSRARNGVRAGARGTRSLTLGDAEAIQHEVPLIKTVVPNVDGPVQVVYGGQNWSTAYRGVSPQFMQVRRWEVAAGTFFTEAEVNNNALVCVLGQTVAGLLFGDKDPVGQTVRIKDLPFKVIGVFTAKGYAANGRDQDDVIAVPYTTVQKRITGEFWLDDIFCSAVSRESMPEASREIKALLRERHHLGQQEEDDFNIRSPEELLLAQLGASHIMTVLLASIAALALLVGGIGIMNIMLVSVSQRTHEIGLRMALGATEQDVQAQFLGEALVLSLIGGVLGMIGGITAATGIGSIALFPTKLTTATLVLAGLFSPCVGILFGYYPARRASQLDPIQALRYE